MKKILFVIFLISFLTGTELFSQPSISFRINSPRVIMSGNSTYGDYCENLEFDIEVSSSASTYYHGLEVHMTTNNSALTDLDFTPGALCTVSGTFYSIQTYSLLKGNINLSVANSKPQTTAWLNHTWWTQLTTSWQVLGTLRLRITDIASIQNCAWLPALMDVSLHVQAEKVFLGSTPPGPSNGIRDYSALSLVSTPIANLYLARIYSNTWGWSQIGGPIDTQYIDWTTGVNTSVWDTIPTGGTGTIASTDKNCQATNLRIHPGAKLIIKAGGELKVSGVTEITEPKGLWIESTSSGSGSWMDNGEGSITYNGSASIRVQRYVGQNNWHGIAMPLHTVSAWGSLWHTYIKWYDEARSVREANVMAKYRYIIGWNSDTVINGDLKGYMHWSSSSVTPSFNTINYTASSSNKLVSGAWSRSLTRTAFLSGTDPFDGYNLVGNMYPCPVDWKAASGWTKTNVDPTIYLWSQSQLQYATYNASNDATTLGGTRYIPAMQGYFVHSSAAGTLGMNNTVKVFNSQAFWKEQQSFSEQLTLNVAGNGYRDETKVWFNPTANVNFDPNEDNYKLTGDVKAPQLYSVLADGQDAAVNVLPFGGLNTVVPLGFFIADSTVTNAPMAITASNIESFKPGTRIYLEDKKDASMNELTVNPVYTFTASPSDDPNRFALHFYNPAFGIEGKNLAGMQIYSFEEYVYVRNLVKGTTKGTIQMYDMLGRKVFQGSLKDMELNKYLPGVNEGYYMVRVANDENSYTQKVYLK